MTTYLENLIHRALLFAALCCLVSCTPPPHRAVLNEVPQGTPPVLLLGEFEDDYGIHYSISKREWQQKPGSNYRVVKWRTDAQYLIAQNHTANPALMQRQRQPRPNGPSSPGGRHPGPAAMVIPFRACGERIQGGRNPVDPYEN